MKRGHWIDFDVTLRSPPDIGGQTRITCRRVQATLARKAKRRAVDAVREISGETWTVVGVYSYEGELGR